MTKRLTLLEKVDRLILRELKGWGRPSKASVRESIALWNVLTALRGPDNENDMVKTRTTAVIRGAMPGLYKLSKDNGAYAYVDRDYCRICADDGGPHFYTHAQQAARVLRVSESFCPRHEFTGKLKPTKIIGLGGAR